MYILVWKIEEQQYATRLSVIQSVLLATEVSHLPNAPQFILGAINVHGHITPVVNTRKLLNLPHKPIEVQDHFILAQVHQQQMAICVDHVRGILSCEEKDLMATQEVLPHVTNIDSVLKEEGKIILLYDFDKLIPKREIHEK